SFIVNLLVNPRLKITGAPVLFERLTSACPPKLWGHVNIDYRLHPAIVRYHASSRAPGAPAPGQASPPVAPGEAGRRRMPGPARLRPIAYALPRIVCEAGRNGALHCRSSEPLAPYDPSLARLFRAAVERNPAGLFLAERRRRLAQVDLCGGAPAC